jgi:hypothetical protein
VSRKRIWYWIDAPGDLWWVDGFDRPISVDNPNYNGNSFSSARTAQTAKAARRIAAKAPGCEVIRLMTVRGKTYELRRWLTSAK